VSGWLVSGWLVSGLSASRQLAGQSCPVTKISILTEGNASLYDPPHPLGLESGTLTWCQLVARHQGYLLQPSLTEAPWLLTHHRGQEGEKVFLQI